MDGESVALSMSYNKGNQLTAMANGKNKITYSYDKNGSMVQKVLSSQTYGKLTDTYAYNALDQLTSYTGYDGYTQQFTYDANGMRLSKSEAGDANRSTLEELLRGEHCRAAGDRGACTEPDQRERSGRAYRAGMGHDGIPVRSHAGILSGDFRNNNIRQRDFRHDGLCLRPGAHCGVQ